jgi:hypothetical protein
VHLDLKTGWMKKGTGSLFSFDFLIVPNILASHILGFIFVLSGVVLC